MQWKSLRDAFVKQQRKRQGATGLVRPYIYENEMQFLLPHILMKERDEYGSGDDKGDDVPLSKFEVKTEDSVSLSASVSGDSQPDMEFEEESEDVGNSLTQAAERKNRGRVAYAEMHPVDAFFQGIAQTVKQLTPSTVAKVKKAVANIVMDAEIDELEGSREGST